MTNVQLLEYPGYRMTDDLFYEIIVREFNRQLRHDRALKRLRYSYAYGGKGPMVDQIRQECYQDIIPITDPARLLVYGTTAIRGLTSVPIYPKDCAKFSDFNFSQVVDPARWDMGSGKRGYFDQVFRGGAWTGRKSVSKDGINLEDLKPMNPVRYACDLSRPVKPFKKGKRPDGKVTGCSWLQAPLDRRSLAFTVQRLAQEIKKSGIKFDGIAFRGLSGTLVGPMLAVRLKKDILAIRKNEHQHSTYGVEGVVRGGSYIIVDDLIDSGRTVRAIQTTLDEHHEKHSALYEEFPPFILAGIFLYAGGRNSVTTFSDHVSDRAGLGTVPVFSLHCATEFETIQTQRKKQHGKQKHKA